MATSEKIIVKNSRFVNFWAREVWSTSKKFPEHQWFRFDPKLEILLIKVLKRIDVYDFHLKNFVNFCRTRSIFWTVIEDMLKITLLSWAQHNSWKIQEFWEHFDHSLRNGSQCNLLSGGLITPSPPHLLGLILPYLNFGDWWRVSFQFFFGSLVPSDE